MEFTNDTLKDIKEKQKYNEIYGHWYYGMSKEFENDYGFYAEV